MRVPPHNPAARAINTGRRHAMVVVLLLVTACKGILDVELPGRVLADQLDDPTLATVLVNGVIGDFECAYNHYTGGAAVHSDEFVDSDAGDLEAFIWGSRAITPDEGVYAQGGCENTLFGMYVPLHTARFQAEDVFNRLSGWTDEQVANRTALLATVRAYGAYTYVFFGETFCEAAFDKGPIQDPLAALRIAEAQFGEAISLAQTAGSNEIVNFARVGLARTRLGLGKFAEAIAVSEQVAVGYQKVADRGTERARRWNKLFRAATDQGRFVVSEAYRALNDPRVPVENTGESVGEGVEHWITTKYTGLSAPIRIASYLEAQLIRAEALARSNQVGPAIAIVNARRGQLGLSPLSAVTPAEAVAHIIEERRRELAFEGGHRLNDLLRTGASWKTGLNPYSGHPYGAATCFPLPTVERDGF